MKNHAQMKQEFEYWEQADAQQPTPDTQPIPQQNQQLDIQPMFDIQRQTTRKRSTAKQHLHTTPHQNTAYKQSTHSRRQRESFSNPKYMQNTPSQQYAEPRPHNTYKQNIPTHRRTQPRRNAAPNQNPHIQHNPYAQQAYVRTPNPRARHSIQQPPYMPQLSPTRQNSYESVRHSGTRQNLRAQQNTSVPQPPFIQTPQRQSRNPATRQTANLPPNATISRKNHPKNAAAPHGQASKKIRRATAPVKKKNTLFQLLAVLMILVVPVTIFLWTKFAKTEVPVTAKPTTGQKITVQEDIREDTTHHPPIEENFLTISEYNRPGTKLASVKNIFVHYTANPGTTAAQNRSYFENLGETHERSASAHFIIGCEGEVIQCIPLEEEAYAVIGRNNDSISIECCYRSEDGKFTQATYDSLISMLAWLTKEYQLEPTDILRHYDCGGKRCPLYYVDHEDAWLKLLEDVSNYLAQNNTSL